ncbi:MAG: hypothetical protein WBH20_08825 [Oceanisphaera sp.]|uniref:hypothetical protein n=1 Tax=Oceanisphaera sp. TaxID=1929979 RepID=UPI003C740701
MWKKHFTRPRLLLWLALLLLVLLTGWQWLQVTQLGHHWRQFPQRTLATPLADYAEQQAVRALLTEDEALGYLLVTELANARLISSAQLYEDSGHLLAESAALTDEDRIEPTLPYVRPLYQEGEPIGFLRLQLANNPIAVAQRNIWQQLEYYLGWLLPLCLLLGLLLGLGLQHWRQHRQKTIKSE